MVAVHRPYGVGESVQDGRHLLGDDERRQQPYDVRARARDVHDQPAAQALLTDGGGEFGGGAGAGTVGGAVGRTVRRHQLDPGHQAPPAHVAHAPELRGQGAQSHQHPAAQRGGVFGEPLFADVGEGGGAGRASWLPEGARTGSIVPVRAPQVVAVDHHGQRQAAADRLGEDQHVGCDSAVLEGPVGTGPADARPGLVDDERDGPFGGAGAHVPYQGVRRRVHPGLAPDRFQEEPGGWRLPGSRASRTGSWPSARVTTRVRPVAARTSAAAVATGSVPVGPQTRTRARSASPGGSVRSSSVTKASSTGVVRSMTCKGAPDSRTVRIAARTTGWLWPRARVPAPETQSR
ncbi:hypothetical protein SVIOM342S_04009 [Streptomyces violaceorubidus]